MSLNFNLHSLAREMLAKKKQQRWSQAQSSTSHSAEMWIKIRKTCWLQQQWARVRLGQFFYHIFFCCCCLSRRCSMFSYATATTTDKLRASSENWVQNSKLMFSIELSRTRRSSSLQERKSFTSDSRASPNGNWKRNIEVKALERTLDVLTDPFWLVLAYLSLSTCNAAQAYMLWGDFRLLPHRPSLVCESRRIVLEEEKIKRKEWERQNERKNGAK